MFEICNLDMLTLKIIERVATKESLNFSSEVDIYGVKTIDVCKRKCEEFIKQAITEDEKIKRYVAKLFVESDIEVLENGKVVLTTDIHKEIAKYFLRLSSNLKVISDNIKDVIKYSEMISNAIATSKIIRIIPAKNLEQISEIAGIDYEIYEIFLKVVVSIFLNDRKKDKLYHFENAVRAIDAFWPELLKKIVQNEYIKYSEFVESVVLFNLRKANLKVDNYEEFYLRKLEEFIK